MLQQYRFITALAALLTGLALASMALPTPAAGFAGAPPVSDARLAQLRGGFAIGSGSDRVRLSFSIERLSFINGELAAITTLNPTSKDGVHVIQNGAGNLVDSALRDALPSDVLGTVIQNSLDNQTIGNLNIYNVTVTSRQAAQSLSMQSSLRDALAASSLSR